MGESPNLGKHAVSIDLHREDMSLLGLARRLRFPGSIKDDPGEDAELAGALAAVAAITIEISY